MIVDHLTGDSQLQSGRSDSFSASKTRKRDQPESTTAEKKDAVTEQKHLENLETGDLETEAEKSVVDEVPGAKVKQT